MSVSIYEAKTQLSKLIQSLIDKEQDSIIISKNGKPVVEMRLIPKSSKRIGIAKKELSQYDYSDFDEIDVSALFSKDDLL